MFAAKFSSFQMVTQAFARLPGAAKRARREIGPGRYFPNFQFERVSGLTNFWDWAEGSWVSVACLPDSLVSSADQLLSYALAADGLHDARIKTLFMCPNDQQQLDQLAEDVSALAGKELNAVLVADPYWRKSDRLGLRVQKSSARSPLFKSVVIAPNLFIDHVGLADVPCARTAYQMLAIVKTLQQRSFTAQSDPVELGHRNLPFAM